MSDSHYQVSGDRQGTVTVTDTQTKEVIRTFEMDAGVVVRETFLLEKGKVVAACQKNHAVFWDLETGEEIRRFSQRICGFSHDETKFFTHEKKIFLYAYPEMTWICQLSEQTYGPHIFQFSPDNRFLIVITATGLPARDEHYPRRNPVRRSTFSFDLFDLEKCQEIKEFTAQLRAIKLGQFSPDSRFYDIKDTEFRTERGPSLKGNWRFDLETYTVTQIFE